MLDYIFQKLERFLPLKYRWILNHDGFKRYFANTGWMFAGQMFSLLVSFFIGAWLARYLGPENYGVLSYAVAFVGLFGFVASLGVDGILNRELVEFPEKRDELLGTAFRLKLIGGTIAIVLCVAGAFIFQTSSIIRLLIILFSLTFILQTINIISTYFLAEVKSKINVKTILTATLISSILKVAIILSGKGVIWIMIIFVLDLFWQGVGLVSAYRKFGLKIKNWFYNKILAREMLKNAWPLMLAAAAWYIYIRIDQVMVGALLGNLAVGIYAAAVKIAEIWNFIPGIIFASLFPAIINAKNTDLQIYKRRLKALYLLMAGISLSIAVVTTILAPWLIILLFGKAYFSAIIILRIYVWSGVGLFIGGAINQYFLTENRSRHIFLYNLLSMLLNVVLNFILIPRVGLTGAAWATLISYSAGPIVVAVMELLKISGDRKIIRN